MTCCSVHRTQV